MSQFAHLVGYHLPKKPGATISGIINKPIEAYKGKMKLRISNEEFEVRCFCWSHTTRDLLFFSYLTPFIPLSFKGEGEIVVL
jgi:hypothetical protein